MTVSEAYPLIVFTLLSGIAFGLWVTVFVLPSGGRSTTGEQGKLFRVAGWLAVVLQGIALVSSLMHLAQPLSFYRALINWQASWLSREVWFAGLFFVATAAAMVLYELTSRGKTLPAWSLPVLGGLGVVLGLFMSFSSGMIYVDATGYPGWGNPAVVFFFPMTGLAVGIALCFALWLGLRPSRSAAESRFFATLALVLALVATLAIYAAFFVPGSLAVKLPQVELLALALLVLVTWVVYFLMLVTPKFLTPLWVWLAFGTLALCVVLTRVWFYTYAVHL